jgi:hypothetical protein
MPSATPSFPKMISPRWPFVGNGEIFRSVPTLDLLGILLCGLI